jgi:preprotein translocase subunit SecF
MRLFKIVPDNTQFRFVRLRWIAFTVTALLTLAAVGLLMTRGLNLGVDFVGGLMIEAGFEQPVPLDDLRAKINRMGVGEVSLQEFGSPNNVALRLPLPPGDEEASQAVVKKLQAEIAAEYPGVSFRRIDTVSGKVSNELIRDGILAVLFAMIGITIYSWFRFEWHFGVSTLVGLFHDVIVTLGFFSLTRMEFDLSIVAAILTIVGYSLNDKIVIDDRIRENLRKYRQMDIKTLIDLSVNETLPRTVMTTLSMVLALGSLLLFGGDVIRGFSAAMLLGILIGTYSSIYVSSSLLISLGVGAHTFGPKDDANAGAERTTKRT